jgi:DNA-binding NarL/FixJ family response regulator
MAVCPKGASCGTAVYRRESVYVTDILTDPISIRQSNAALLAPAWPLDMPIPAAILVVDDQPLVRNTIRSLLAEQANWKVYEAENGNEALDLIRELKPHVVVMDIILPDINGIEVAYKTRLRVPETGIILISSHYTCEEAAGLERLFGDGNFIPKSEAGKELIPAINRLLSGERRARKASS